VVYSLLSGIIYSYLVRKNRFYPIIPVVVKGTKELTIYALVDSGAVISLFHNQVADAIGIDLSRGKPIYLPGIVGYVKGVLIDDVVIELRELGFKTTIPIVFTEHISSDLAILGRKGFFEKFEIVFREWRKELELRIIGEK